MHSNQIKEAWCVLKQSVTSYQSRNLELCLKISACNLVYKFLSERPSFCYVGTYVSDCAAHAPEDSIHKQYFLLDKTSLNQV